MAEPGAPPETADDIGAVEEQPQQAPEAADAEPELPAPLPVVLALLVLCGSVYFCVWSIEHLQDAESNQDSCEDDTDTDCCYMFCNAGEVIIIIIAFCILCCAIGGVILSIAWPRVKSRHAAAANNNSSASMLSAPASDENASLRRLLDATRPFIWEPVDWPADDTGNPVAIVDRLPHNGECGMYRLVMAKGSEPWKEYARGLHFGATYTDPNGRRGAVLRSNHAILLHKPGSSESVYAWPGDIVVEVDGRPISPESGAPDAVNTPFRSATDVEKYLRDKHGQLPAGHIFHLLVIAHPRSVPGCGAESAEGVNDDDAMRTYGRNDAQESYESATQRSFWNSKDGDDVVNSSTWEDDV